MFSISASFHRRLLFIPVLAAVAACGSNDTLPTGPSTLPTVLTETFSGTLTRNSAYTHPFSVTDSGDVSVFLITSADARDANTSIPIGTVKTLSSHDASNAPS